MEEVNIAQMQFLKMDEPGNDERMHIQLPSRHKRKVGEAAERFEVFEGFVDIVRVEIGTII